MNFKYTIRNYETLPITGSLVDGGAGIADNDLIDLGIGTFAAVIETTDGKIVGLFLQYADYGIGKSIHLSSQMRNFGLDALERRIKELIPESPLYHDKDALTDRPIRFFVEERIR